MKQRDIILVPFPFSDQTGKKIRPAVIISSDTFNDDSQDVLVMGITSNLSKDKYTINLNNNNLEEGKLLDECCIKVENILKLDKDLIIKKIGMINKKTMDAIFSKLLQIISINN